jgi:hypothetical protein
MEATLKQIETTTTDSEELKKGKEVLEAVRELASFELSLVGGGGGVPVFA